MPPRAIVFDLFHTLTGLESEWSDLPWTSDVLGIDRAVWNTALTVQSRWRVAGEERDPYRIVERLARGIAPSITPRTLAGAAQGGRGQDRALPAFTLQGAARERRDAQTSARRGFSFGPRQQRRRDGGCRLAGLAIGRTLRRRGVFLHGGLREAGACDLREMPGRARRERGGQHVRRRREFGRARRCEVDRHEDRARVGRDPAALAGKNPGARRDRRPSPCLGARNSRPPGPGARGSLGAGARFRTPGRVTDGAVNLLNRYRFRRLVDKSVRLGNRPTIMPIEELRLAVAFAELPCREEVVTNLIGELFDHQNMHVRRIAVIACRKSGAFGVPGLKEALTRKLADPEGWVRYDAAWAILEAKYDSSEIRACLAALADGISLPADRERVRRNLGDADLQAKVRARETLDALLAPRTILASLGISLETISERELALYPESTELVVAEIGENGREHLLVPAAAAAWGALRDTAKGDGVVIRIVSPFRSVDRQAEIVRAKLARGQSLDEILRVSAPPGYSEHHSGRALDVTTDGARPLELEFEHTAAFQWLERNAGRFGFHMSYPRQNRYGYMYEPWHWCFRGEGSDHA